MKEDGAGERNPALGNLEVLHGDWAMEISNAHFLPSPSDPAKGRVSFEWVQEGAYLVARIGDIWETSSAGTKWEHDFDVTYTLM